MQRAIVIGCPGAGKSTFARALRDGTGLPLYYLDRLWHKPDRTTITPEEFDAALQRILQEERWILDGNYARTLLERLRACDTVFLFDLPVADCLAGAAARIGQQREDLPWLETEPDPQFFQWIEEFHVTKLPQTYALLRDHGAGREIHVFKSRAEASAYLAERFGD